MNGMSYPFANSISEAKNQPTVEGKIRPGMIVSVMNAVNPDALSFYVFKQGSHSDSLPSIFQPNDNAGNYYYEITS